MSPPRVPGPAVRGARPRALVVGGGFGGLTSAMVLAARGWRVHLVEASEQLGGKAGEATVDGVAFDTGPSLLTLPEVLDRTFRLAGSHLEAELTLLRHSPAFRYRWPDGTVVDIHHAVDATIASVEQALGPQAAGDLKRFLGYAKDIWDASAPAFLYDDAPSFGSLFTKNLRTLVGFRQIDAMATMWKAIQRRVRDPKLRMLLARYATYNGSDVRRAPATLNCIAHVELALGGYGVAGGMHAIARALVRRGEALGATYETGAPVTELRVFGGAIEGVTLRDGRRLDADVVVCNADAALVQSALLPEPLRTPPSESSEPSMSGWNAVVRARRMPPERARVGHTVLFPTDYLPEFEAIFDRDEVPADPTVYACDQAVTHGRPGWADADPLFVMVNAPPTRPGGDSLHAFAAQSVRERALARLTDAGLIAAGDPVVWERSPGDLARAFPGSRGSIYGAASNSKFAAFRRPSNRVRRVKGLYLASGSAHPGGGVPLCVLSGLAASRAAAQDCGEDARPLRVVAGYDDPVRTRRGV